MNEVPLNQKTVSMKLRRIDLCDLMLACIAVSQSVEVDGNSAEKWNKLHDELRQILEDFDEKHGFKEE